MSDDKKYVILNGITNDPYPVSNVIVTYATLGGFLGGFIIGAIIFVITLGFGFIITIFALGYGIALGTAPAFLTGLYLGLKRFTIIDGVGWGTVFWVGYFNSATCLFITFMLRNQEDSPSSHIFLALMLAIVGGCSSCLLGSKILPRLATKT